MKITKENWFEIFIPNSSKISSSISRGDMGLVEAILNTSVKLLNYETSETCKALYAVYSLKGSFINIPILPRELSLRIIERFVNLTFNDNDSFDWSED